MWAIPLKNKNSQTIIEVLSVILTSSKGKPIELESDRGKEAVNFLENELDNLGNQNMSQFWVFQPMRLRIQATYLGTRLSLFNETLVQEVQSLASQAHEYDSLKNRTHKLVLFNAANQVVPENNNA